MKKYKLIEEYPGSPKLGAVAEKSKLIKGSWSIGKSFSTEWTDKYFEKYPKNWQEIIEEDYEVLALQFHGRIYYKTGEKHEHYLTKKLHNTFRERCEDPIGMLTDENLEGFTRDRNHTIHSVKRLSDGEVFTVGDIIDDKIGYFFKTSGEIDKIFIDERGNMNFSIKEGTHYSLESCKHYRKPLFTTEDGTDIFEGDTYWCVNTAPHLWSIFQQTAKERTKLNKTVLAFTSAYLAESYVEKNKPKPLFTTEDGVDIFERDYYCFVVNKDIIEIESARDNAGQSICKYFSTKDKAREYIKKNTPLFITEDGVDIFEGDMVFTVSGSKVLHQRVHNNELGRNRLVYGPIFSTEEKALEYQILNNPCLSVNDIISKFNPIHASVIALKKLAKSKL